MQTRLWSLGVFLVALALYLPLFGLTLVSVLVFEATARRWLPGPASWLGLRPA